MTINDVLNEGESLLLESGMRIPENIESFKILHHDDPDGIGSAKMIRQQIINQISKKWKASGKVKDMTDKEVTKFIDKRITTNTVTDSDSRFDILKRLTKTKNQWLAVVDFDRFEKFDTDGRKEVKVMDKLKAVGVNFHSDHHEKSSKEDIGDGKTGATDYGSDTDHLASKTLSKGVNRKTVAQFTKWDTATFDETLEKEIGIKKGDKRYKPARELQGVLTQITRSNRHRGAMDEFLKNSGDSIFSMLAYAKKLRTAVNIHNAANAAAKKKQDYPKKIKATEAKIAGFKKNKKGEFSSSEQTTIRTLVKTKASLEKADKVVQDAYKELKSMGFSGKLWKINPNGSTKMMGSDFSGKAKKDQKDDAGNFGFKSGKKGAKIGIGKNGKKLKPNKELDKSIVNANKPPKKKKAVKESFDDNGNVLNEIAPSAKKAKIDNNRTLEVDENMPKKSPNKKGSDLVKKKHQASKGDRVVVSRLAGAGQPGRYTAFTFKNKHGVKPLFGIRVWPGMVQVSVSPDATSKTKKEIDLDTMTGSILNAARDKFENKKNKSDVKAWDGIVKGGHGYGHATISTVQGFFTLGGFPLDYNESQEFFKLKKDPALKKFMSMDISKSKASRKKFFSKPNRTGIEKKFDRFKELETKSKEKKDEKTNAVGGRKDVINWVVDEYFKRLEKIAKGVVVNESLSESFISNIRSNAGVVTK